MIGKGDNSQRVTIDTESASSIRPQETPSDKIVGYASSPGCRRCMNNLLSTLDSIKSKPTALFEAMGADISSYQRNGTGVQVHIPGTSSSLLQQQTSAGGFGGSSSSSNNSRPEPILQDEIKSKDELGNDSISTKLRRRITESFQSDSSQISSTLSLQDQNINLALRTNAVATSAIPKPALDLQIQCRKCGNEGPEGGARAYVRGPNPLSIVLCSNRLATQEEIEQVLVHELIHVYDVHVRNFDLLNCYTLAKSEIRAAREAECANVSMSFTKRFCVKEKARVATTNMFPDLGVQCVGAVFEESMRDKEPFQKNNSQKADGYAQGRSFQSSYRGDQKEQH
mmetsp:Transcript_23955/g.36484  ORF Transcript_23955/g.36484 Transcript_23955/m.36484 type:complete len:340 (-) Transcript_23955:74-1093(-)